MRRCAGIAFALAAVAASPAVAADLPFPPPQRAPAYLPVMPFSWGGVYVGGNVGWGWTNVDLTDIGPAGSGLGQVFPLGSTSSSSQNGILGGAQIGFNYQLGQFVIGAEGDFDATGIKNNQGSFGLGSTYTEPWTGTVTARLGWAVERALFYGKAGGAWMEEKYSVTAVDGSAISGTFNRWGWTVGAGFEYAVWDNVTFKVEYDYLGFGTANQTLTPNATELVNQTILYDANSAKLSASLVKGGINILFH